MQRIALLLLCTGLGSSSAQADFCERVGQVIAGFAGGATGYGLVRNLGSATNWVSAGLYGAGITVVGIGGQTAGREICENFDDLLNDIMAIYCIAGEYVCDDVIRMAASLYTDFTICAACSSDQIFSAFLLEDSARQDYLRRMQRRITGIRASSRPVSPRSHLGLLNAFVLNSYFLGQQAGYDLLRSASTSMYVIRK